MSYLTDSVDDGDFGGSCSIVTGESPMTVVFLV